MFYQEVISHKDKDFIIIDLRGNRGGNSFYIQKFFYTLFSTSLKTDLKVSLLISQPTIMSIDSLLSLQPFNPFDSSWRNFFFHIWWMRNKLGESGETKTWHRSSSDKVIPPELDPDAFNGTLVFLVDSRTASSGENASILKSLRPIYVLGQNTSGTCAIGDMVSYYLPNSGTQLYLGMKLFEDLSHTYPDQGEGVGYDPDYFIGTKRDLVEALRSITGENPGLLSNEFRMGE